MKAFLWDRSKGAVFALIASEKRLDSVPHGVVSCLFSEGVDGETQRIDLLALGGLCCRDHSQPNTEVSPFHSGC